MDPLPLPSGNTELRWFPTRADKRLNYKGLFLSVLAYMSCFFGAICICISVIDYLNCNSYLIRRVLHILFINESITRVLVMRCIFCVRTSYSFLFASARLIYGMFVSVCWFVGHLFILSRQYVECSICLYNLKAT